VEATLRKSLLALSALIVVAAGGAYFALTSVWLAEKGIERDCKELSPTCLTRMRALGHWLSATGDGERALHWYRQAAEGGDAAAMFHVGWFHEVKVGQAIEAAYLDIVKRAQSGELPEYAEPAASRENREAAENWYRRAADLGFAPAMNNLGGLQMREGTGKRDPAAAARLFTAAAQAGNPVAGFNLSLMYYSGLGVRWDTAEADRWAEWKPGKFADIDLT
jgi:TPR repeat protein